MRSISRVVALVSTAVVISATLVGCTSSDACTPAVAGGSAALVSAPGVIGTKPTVDFPTPLVASTSSVAVIDEGNGRVIRTGDYVDFDATVVRGTDIQELTATSYVTGKAQRIHISKDSTLLGQSFLCQRAGSRFALTGTVQDIFGDVTGNALKPTDTVAVVFDVVAAYPGQSTGVPQIAQDGMPAVTSGVDGRPGIAVPNTDAPTELRIETLTKGDGPVITEGQSVVMHYSGVVWGGTVFDSTWEKDSPATLKAQDFITNKGVGVIPGFAKALIGQSVGSRVVAVIPPSEGYPADQWPQSIPTGATLIFVIDILGVQ